eukprot:COSAG01_NODE_273_length_19739_cov_90.981925_11_plen_135_part_00
MSEPAGAKRCPANTGPVAASRAIDGLFGGRSTEPRRQCGHLQGGAAAAAILAALPPTQRLPLAYVVAFSHYHTNHWSWPLQWYTDKFTTTFEDELDAIRQHPGFGGRDVNQLIGCIEGGAAVFRSIDEHLRNHL